MYQSTILFILLVLPLVPAMAQEKTQIPHPTGQPAKPVPQQPAKPVPQQPAKPVPQQPGDRATQTAPSAPLIHFGPQPARSLVWFTFTLLSREHVRLEILASTGSHIATLLDAELEAGAQIVWWNAATALPGIYAWRLRVGDAVRSGEMAVMR